MEISQVTPPILSQPNSTLGLSASADPREVAEAFESVFASMLIKEMRKTLSDGFFGGEQSDVLGGLFDLHIGKAMSLGGGLGIRDLVLSQLEAQSESGGKEKTAEAIMRYVENGHENEN